MSIAFLCIISNPFSFFWVFKKHGYSFDDASKNSCSRPSLTIICLGGQIDTHLWFFEKCIFYREGGTLIFVTFNFI